MTLPRTRVLYVVGTTRCGSTVLSNLLGQTAGLVHVGELAQIWDEGFVRNFRCGCRLPFLECPFWRRVVDVAFRDRLIEPERLLTLVRASARTRHAMSLPSKRGRRRMVLAMAEHTDAMTLLYRAISQVTGARVVIDSSKTPLLAWLAAQRPEIELRILHLTRDPRAVAYSWRRTKYDPARTGDLHRETVLKTSLTWLIWNALAARLWGGDRDMYLQLRYEDFVVSPQRVMEGILAWLGEPSATSPRISADGSFVAAQAHSIAGNPMRFGRGASRVALDTEWQHRMSTLDRLLASGITWPLLSKYRYPFRARCEHG